MLLMDINLEQEEELLITSRKKGEEQKLIKEFFITLNNMKSIYFPGYL